MNKLDNTIMNWFSEMYDRFESYSYDVEFALSVIGSDSKRILEIGCGSGRFLVPLAIAGHNVTGIDANEHLLNRITSKISNIQNIHWNKLDAISDEWETGFDIVLLASNFLENIVTDMDYMQAQKTVINKSADSLVSGGHIFIDYNYTFFPEKIFNRKNYLVWQGTDNNNNYGKMLLTNNTYDKQTRDITLIRRYEMTLADGSNYILEKPEKKHFLAIEQLREWLKNVGFIMFI